MLVDTLASAYEAVTRAVVGRDDGAFLTATRCRGWTVADLLFHLLLDAQRALVTLATPSSETPDVDAVTYWTSFTAGGGAPDHVRFVRISSAAYSRPSVLVAHWSETADAAVRAARAAAGTRAVATQGHVLALDDFVATLVVEAAVHHLDLTAFLPGPSSPSPDTLATVRRTLDGLLGVEPPLDWDDVTYALKGTGRLDLNDAERAALGDLASRFPLFG